MEEAFRQRLGGAVRGEVERRRDGLGALPRCFEISCWTNERVWCLGGTGRADP